SGTHVEQGGAPYNAAEPLPPKLVLKAASPAAGTVASSTVVESILEEINQLPPVRASQKQVPFASLPVFSGKIVDDYQPDYQSWPELVRMAKDKDKYPVRAAVLEAIKALKASGKIAMRESFSGTITPQVKKQFAATQQEPGIMIFELESA